MAIQGCGEDRSATPVAEATAAPTDPLANLTAGSDAWIVAHAPLFIDGESASRHAALEASLTSHDNGYARTRLMSYALPDGGWDDLPEWNPLAVPLDRTQLARIERGEPVVLPDDAGRLATLPSSTTSWDAWRDLGERVFFDLPLRAEPALALALASPVQREALGVVADVEGALPGVVVFRSVEGRAEVGITCALCHSAREGDAIIAGRARRTLDFGRIRLAALERRGPVEARTTERYTSWGPGRADVLEHLSEVPIAIPDLWGLRRVRYFTQGGTLTHDSPLTLAIRQETQFIQANHLATRPPRSLVFALVVYLYSLTPPALRSNDASPEVRTMGALVFARECGRCHGDAVHSGDLVPVEEVGTHPELGTGRARGTGRYRPAPLIDVRDAAPYFHHGVVPSLEVLLSRERFAADYSGVHDTGPIEGHAYGLDLTSDERSALMAHLETL